MSDPRERIRAIERTDPPEYWDDAVSRRPRRLSDPRNGRVARAAVAAVALVLSATAIGFAVRAFERGARAPEPAATYVNGALWIHEGGAEGGTRIASVDVATGDVHQLWQNVANPAFPNIPVREWAVADDYAFSPDGSRVAFSRHVEEGPGSCCYELFTMNADGTDLVQRTHDLGYVSFPSWSPDGSRIVFARYDGSNFVPGCELTRQCPADLYVINAAGTDEHAITNDADDEATPAWSPDGSRIAYVRSSGGAWNASIETIAPDAGDRNVVVPPGNRLVLAPTWSPDGTELAFESAAPDGPIELDAVDVVSGTVRSLADTGRDTSGGRPVWSPDGTSVAFANRADGEDEVWIVGADGSNPHRVASAPRYGAVPLAWQPEPIDAAVPSSSHATTPAETASEMTAPTAPETGTTWTDAADGISIAVPPSWTVVEHASGPYEPETLFALANYSLPRGGGCSPSNAIDHLPANGALAWVMEYHEANVNDFPPRPDRFTLDGGTLADFECAGRSYEYRYEDSGRHFQMHVMFGPDASAETKRTMLASLSSLAVDRCPPVVEPSSVAEFGSLSATSGRAGDAVTVEGPTVRDEAGFWVPVDRIEVWLTTNPSTIPQQQTESQRLLAVVDPKSSCTFTSTFAAPDVRSGDYVVSVIAYGPGAEGGGLMGARAFTVLP
jgi:Tol biopolymer transport system component